MSPPGPATVWSSTRATSTVPPSVPNTSMNSLVCSTPMSQMLPLPLCSMVCSSNCTSGSSGISVSLSGEVGGLLPSPRVVGLAAGRAHQLVEQEYLPRHLVARHLGAAVGDDVVGRRRAAGPGLHEGRHPLAPLVVGDADHDGVEQVGVALQGGLDLLGVDLLAPGVDAHRPTAEHE